VLGVRLTAAWQQFKEMRLEREILEQQFDKFRAASIVFGSVLI
jgi:hypothetical protein